MEKVMQIVSKRELVGLPQSQTKWTLRQVTRQRTFIMIIGPIQQQNLQIHVTKTDRIKGRNRNATKPVADFNAHFQ